jgi:hypothetical protein
MTDSSHRSSLTKGLESMTPRTDAQHAKWRIADDPYGAMTEHARRLESELIGALEALKNLVLLAESAMKECGQYDIRAELQEARAAIAKATK